MLIKATSILGAIFLINTLAIVALTSKTTSAYGKVHADDATAPASAEVPAQPAPASQPAQ